NRWMHVCIVNEGAKIRLYLNGTLDSQRTTASAHRTAAQAPHPIFVGRPAHATPEASRPSTEGFQGAVAHLRLYTRALSPIHVRIICEPGPPPAEPRPDAMCHQLSATLCAAAAASTKLRGAISAAPWAQLWLSLLLGGSTIRLRTSAARMLALLAPHMDPAHL
ncbi:hypothetical protein JKP88DRAFT_145229, partial [Tribonema minus]